MFFDDTRKYKPIISKNNYLFLTIVLSKENVILIQNVNKNLLCLEDDSYQETGINEDHVCCCTVGDLS